MTVSQEIRCGFAVIFKVSVLCSLLLYLHASGGSLCRKYKECGVSSGVCLQNCWGALWGACGGCALAPLPHVCREGPALARACVLRFPRLCSADATGVDSRCSYSPLSPAHLHLGVQWRGSGVPSCRPQPGIWGALRKVLEGNGLAVTGYEQSESAYQLSSHPFTSSLL